MKAVPVNVEVFYSEMCPYCPAAIKLVREVNAKFSDIIVEEVDTSTSEGMTKAAKYQIVSVPTIVINGEVAFVGVPGKAELTEAVETKLKTP